MRTVVDDFWETTPPPESDHFWSAFDVVDGRARPCRRCAAGRQGRGRHARSGPGAAGRGQSAGADRRARCAAHEEDRVRDRVPRRGDAPRGARSQAHRGAVPRGPVSELEHPPRVSRGVASRTILWTPYKNIVALGAHSAVLHYVAYEKTKVSGDTSLLVDAGARCNGYGSDITRTYVRGTSGAGEAVRRAARAHGQAAARDHPPHQARHAVRGAARRCASACSPTCCASSASRRARDSRARRSRHHARAVPARPRPLARRDRRTTSA